MTKKYEEDKYLLGNIKDKIYPWLKESLVDYEALNGKLISEKDTPLISFVGDLMVVLVIRRSEEQYEIVKDNMLPPDCDIEELYHTACANLVRDVEFVISHTWYGGFGIVADGRHEASALCFKHIWNLCTEKLADDIIIAVPSKGMVLFVPAKEKEQIESMKIFAKEAYDRNKDKISTTLLRYSREGKELTVYE